MTRLLSNPEQSFNSSNIPVVYSITFILSSTTYHTLFVKFILFKTFISSSSCLLFYSPATYYYTPVLEKKFVVRETYDKSLLN